MSDSSIHPSCSRPFSRPALARRKLSIKWPELLPSRVIFPVHGVTPQSRVKRTEWKLCSPSFLGDCHGKRRKCCCVQFHEAKSGANCHSSKSWPVMEMNVCRSHRNGRGKRRVHVSVGPSRGTAAERDVILLAERRRRKKKNMGRLATRNSARAIPNRKHVKTVALRRHTHK